MRGDNSVIKNFALDLRSDYVMLIGRTFVNDCWIRCGFDSTRPQMVRADALDALI